MDSATELTDILLNKTIKYFHSITKEVPNTQQILKSYYLSKLRILQLKGNVYLQKPKIRTQTSCPRCCLKFSETQASFKIKPEEKSSKFGKKVLKKVKDGKILTRFQTKYLKKMNPSMGNQLAVTCNFCKKEVIHNLDKPVKIRTDSNTNKKGLKKKRGKKKKDKFCGLQKEAVISAQSGNNNNNNNNNAKKEPQEKNKVIVNTISKRKLIKKQKENNRKLSKILTQAPDPKSNTNNLVHFLQSFS